MDLKVGQMLISRKTTPYRTEGQAYKIKTVLSDAIMVLNNRGSHGRFTFKEVEIYFKLQSHELWV